MNSVPIIALIGVAILVTSTIGFGASLGAGDVTFNLIGASDNNSVTTARGNITALAWTEEVALDGVVETDEILFYVGNEDTTNAHEFQICAVIEGPASTFSPVPGQPPACTTTGTLAANSNSTVQTISFVNATDVNDIVDISLTIEELE